MAFVMDRDCTKEIIVLLSAVFNSSILAYGAFNGRQVDGSPFEESQRAAILTKAKGDLAAAFDRYIEGIGAEKG